MLERKTLTFLLVLLFLYRSDHKEIIDEVSENQQSGYAQCKFDFRLFVTILMYYLHKFH